MAFLSPFLTIDEKNPAFDQELSRHDDPSKKDNPARAFRRIGRGAISNSIMATRRTLSSAFIVLLKWSPLTSGPSPETRSGGVWGLGVSSVDGWRQRRLFQSPSRGAALRSPRESVSRLPSSARGSFGPVVASIRAGLVSGPINRNPIGAVNAASVARGGTQRKGARYFAGRFCVRGDWDEYTGPG